MLLFILRIKEHTYRAKTLCLLYTSIIVVVNLTLTPAHFGLANAQQQNNTSMQPQGTQSVATTNATNVNIVLVQGTWVDGSSWSKVISILQNAGHKVIAVQLPLHSIADDVARLLTRPRLFLETAGNRSTMSTWNPAAFCFRPEPTCI